MCQVQCRRVSFLECDTRNESLKMEQVTLLLYCASTVCIPHKVPQKMDNEWKPPKDLSNVKIGGGTLNFRKEKEKKPNYLMYRKLVTFFSPFQLSWGVPFY
mmetsp:Transcript_16989/g.20413  ORF Transcript_16989/g.20413 Transcript_16989/m.20413 type:complete len:101 (-) Transcript_16989:232-534(-)